MALTLQGGTPQNQLDALPINNPLVASGAGGALVMPGVRYYSPAVLGINDTARTNDPDIGGGSLIVSNLIDVTGATLFLFNLGINIKTFAGLGGIDAAAVGYNLLVQSQVGFTSPAGAPTLRTGTYGLTLTPTAPHIKTINISTDAAFPRCDIANFAWSNTTGPAQQLTVANGNQIRLWMRWTIAGKAAADLSYTGELWASVS